MEGLHALISRAKAELKHGRIAMLAWVGLVAPEFVRIPGWALGECEGRLQAFVLGKGSQVKWRGTFLVKERSNWQSKGTTIGVPYSCKQASRLSDSANDGSAARPGPEQCYGAKTVVEAHNACAGDPYFPFILDATDAWLHPSWLVRIPCDYFEGTALPHAAFRALAHDSDEFHSFEAMRTSTERTAIRWAPSSRLRGWTCQKTWAIRTRRRCFGPLKIGWTNRIHPRLWLFQGGCELRH